MTLFFVFLLLLAALGVAWGGSFWIDRLYGRNLSILTFPDAIASRSRWRKPLLFIGFLGCGLRLLQLASGLPLVLMLVFTAFLLWMTATDFEQYCLFDSMMLPFALAALVMLATYPDMLVSHLLAGLAGGLVFLVLGILSRGALGGGDIKLLAALGLWMGHQSLVFTAAAGTVLGGLAALVLLLAGQKNRKSSFAYGPYFMLTALALMLVRGL